MHIACYVRLSLDHGGQTATARQEAACRAFAEARGWTISEVYEDVDVSAYLPKVVRPAFERLLVDIAEQRHDGVLLWKLDRGCRRPADFERLWSTVDRAGGVLVSATEPIDTSTELGLAIVRILVTIASLESATMGLRLKARWEHDARSGKPPSKAIGYGHVQGYQALHPVEAPMVQEASRRVVAGESLRSICIDWNARGVATHRGGARWDLRVIKQILISPRIAGHRAYKGEVVARDCWPAIIDNATYERVVAILTDPRRQTGQEGRRYLLRGLGFCGLCEGRLVGSGILGPQRRRKPGYRCPAPPTACGHIFIYAEPLEAFILEQLRDRLVEPGPRPKGIVDDLSRQRTIEALRIAAHDYYVSHSISRHEFFSVRRGLEHGLSQSDEVAANRAECRRKLNQWDTLTIDEQRTLVRSELSQFTVSSKTTEFTFDPARVKLHWRDDRLA